jgi:hypothetical protein
VVYLARRFGPAVQKYYQHLDREIARALAKCRAQHPHPGRPCDRAGCANRPDWMQGAPTVTEHLDGPHLAAAPDYPTREVGGPIAALVDATPGLPAALVGGAALAALAHLAAPARLHVHPGWLVAPILWFPCSAPPVSASRPRSTGPGRRCWSTPTSATARREPTRSTGVGLVRLRLRRAPEGRAITEGTGVEVSHQDAACSLHGATCLPAGGGRSRAGRCGALLSYGTNLVDGSEQGYSP